MKEGVFMPTAKRMPMIPRRSASEPSADHLLTIAQLADMLGCSHQALYNLRARGTGPASFLLAGKVRYRRSSVAAWIADAEAADARSGG